MSRKSPNEFQKVYAGIAKNLRNKKWECIIDTCGQPSINSHLLQQNGILNLISEDNHVIEVKPTDVFKWGENSAPLAFRRVSVKNAMSLKLFCKTHDSEIFKDAETPPLKLTEYRTHILFTYRTLCAEIRKKENNLETYKRLLNSETLKGTLPEERFQEFIDGSKRGIEDLNIYRSKIEAELDGAQEEFNFKVFKYPLIKVYCSAGFNLYESSQTAFVEVPLKYVFIHIVPSENSLNIIVGYNKTLCKESILDYVNSWDNLSTSGLEKQLTNLFATRVENWGLSPNILDNMYIETETDFVQYFADNSLNHSINQSIDFNLFEDENYGVKF